MKVAIVGTSINLTDDEERDVRQFCAMIIKDHPPDSIIISGSAQGVDSIAIEVARGLGYTTKQFYPKEKKWDDYKERNLLIAKKCDKLFCVTIPTRIQKCYHHRPKQDHEKTAGCWTMKKALDLQKPCRLLVTPSR